MTERELRVADDVDGVVDAAVGILLAERPRTIALSGGSTPKDVYERLAVTDYAWSEVEAFFGDERCVPLDHPDSNYRMANEALLSKVPARAHPMVDCDADAYEEELRAVFGDRGPAFDLAFMGLGEDGHTASLFPGNPALEVRDRWAVHVPEPGMPPPHPRLTLTLPVFDAARLSLFLVSGEAKRIPLRHLMNGDDIPAARVHSDRVVVLADRAAAG